MNLILVKFDLEMTRSSRKKVMKGQGRKNKTSLASNHGYWQASIGHGDSGGTGQSAIASEPAWKQSKEEREMENDTKDETNNTHP